MVNLLFITNPTAPEPFVSAYDLDYPGLNKRQWRVDKVRGVESGVSDNSYGLKGVWGYLYEGKWQQLTQQEAYARFPELQAAIENWVEPW